MLRRALLVLFSLACISALALYLSFDRIVDHYGRKKLDKIAERVGHPIDCQTIELLDLRTIRLTNLNVGPIQKPFITIAEILVDLDRDALKDFKVHPTRVTVRQPILTLTSDGTLAGVARALRDLLPEKLRKTGAANDGQEKRLPELMFSGARLVDTEGAVSIVDGQGALRERTFTAEGNVKVPGFGRCQVKGDLTQAYLDCEKSYTRQVGAGFEISLRQAHLVRKPTPSIRLPRIQLLRSSKQDDLLGAFFSGMSADFQVTFPDDQSEWPVVLNLRLPGGGQIAGRGIATRESLEVAAQVKALKFGHAQKNASGVISGNYRIRASRPDRLVYVSGSGKLSRLIGEHPALSERPVGPVDISFGGRLSGRYGRGSNPDFGMRLSDGFCTVGRVKAKFGVEFEKSTEKMTVQAYATVDPVDAKDLRAAIPSGLIPRLEPIEAVGKIGFRSALYLDLDDYDATILKIEVPKKGFRIVRLNSSIHFERLRHRFKTSHVLSTKGGLEVTQTRYTGPLSSRWVPLDEMPPLLPTAVRSQEDWGFYRHSGISVFHLRGSLVSNLKHKRFRRGGSTMTMQLARNLFLTRKKTLSRKLQEVILAWLMEQRLDKDELMALYLNVVELGPDIYGIGEASQHYFLKKPKELTPAEIAWIVRLLPGPRPYYRSFQLGKLTPGRLSRINGMLKRLISRGALTAEEGMPIGRQDLWPNGNGGRAKKTVNGIPVSALRKARKRSRPNPSITGKKMPRRPGSKTAISPKKRRVK